MDSRLIVFPLVNMIFNDLTQYANIVTFLMSYLTSSAILFLISPTASFLLCLRLDDGLGACQPSSLRHVPTSFLQDRDRCERSHLGSSLLTVYCEGAVKPPTTPWVNTRHATHCGTCKGRALGSGRAQARIPLTCGGRRPRAGR